MSTLDAGLPFDEREIADTDRKLWRAVLEQSTTDAATPIRPTTRADDRRAILEARAWFDLASADFLEVCDLANACPRHALAHVAPLIAKAKLEDGKEDETIPRPQVPLTHDGETRTLTEWAEIIGVSVPALVQRIFVRGMEIDEALTRPAKEPRLITYRGTTKSVAKWAEEYGLDRNTIVSRHERGIPFEAPIIPRATRNTRGLGRRARFYTHDGKTLTLGQWAEVTGIAIPTLYDRLIKQGMSITDALTRPVSGRGKPKPTEAEAPGGGSELPATYKGPARVSNA